VRPALQGPGTKPIEPTDVAEKDQNGKNGGGGGPPEIDPIIKGLLDQSERLIGMGRYAQLLARLPRSGAQWPKAQRKLWLQLLEGSFDLIYTEKDEAAN
jgi:hypothetical protein